MSALGITLLAMVAAGGTLTGRAIHPAPVAPPERLDVHVNTSVCGAKPIHSQRMLVSADGAIENVVVSIIDLPIGSTSPSTANLEQEACVFRPHVQSVVVGSTLDIGNSDPVIHNVHGRLGQRTIFNFAMPIPGLRVRRKVDEVGVVSIVCDSGHAWMSAFVVVVPNRFHATTGADGYFALTDVPAGRHVVRAWHEKLGAREQTVTIEEGVTSELSFDFSREPKPSRETPRSVAQVREATTTPVEPPARVRADVHAIRAQAEGAYRRHCATCHGVGGDGRGPTTPFLEAVPRDFRLGVFKIRSTPSGRLPTEDDLFRTISLGLPGSDMPGFRRRLNVSERRLLARYVMSYSSRFLVEAPAQPIEIPPGPPVTPDSIRRGRAIYEKLQCAQCHGVEGLIDTAENDEMLDDWDRPIKATELRGGVFKGGDTGPALYRTLSTGLDGSPMPSFEAVLSPDDRWALVRYVSSIRTDR